MFVNKEEDSKKAQIPFLSVRISAIFLTMLALLSSYSLHSIVCSTILYQYLDEMIIQGDNDSIAMDS